MLPARNSLSSSGAVLYFLFTVIYELRKEIFLMAASRLSVLFAVILCAVFLPFAAAQIAKNFVQDQ